MKEYKNLEFDGGNNKILAMHDERSPYFYLPGGRVQMGETAEHAVVRGVEEEDYIIKSPMKRIHKVKTAVIVKDTIPDEKIEILRDNCNNLRDRAMIDFLL